MKGSEGDWLRFLEEYHRRRPQHERVLTQILALLDEYRRTTERDPKQRVHSVRGRIKSARSLAAKARRVAPADGLNPEAAFAKVSDIVGVRIVCNTVEGKAAACAWIGGEGAAVGAGRLFHIREARTVEYDTGYRSQHYLINLFQAAWPTLRLDPLDNDETVTIEVQVRTILEEGWGEIEHDLLYKTDQPPMDGGNSAVLRPGFVALSHRLHDADILVQRLTRRIANVPLPTRAATIAANQRSLSVDAAGLGLAVEAIPALEQGLQEADRYRYGGHHEQAFELHTRLRADLRFMTPSAQRVLWSEMALDRVMLAETVLQETGDGAQAGVLFGEAWDLYEQAHAADPRGSGIVVWWRQAKIRAQQGRLGEARELYARALQDLERDGLAPYIRTPFYKAGIKARLGAILHRECEEASKEAPAGDGRGAPDAILLREAELFLVQAVGDMRDARPRQGVVPQEWMLDALLAYNNLSWFQLSRGNLASALETVQRARADVDPTVWEQDLSFLDTILAVELACLPPSPDFGQLTWLDSLRIRILNLLSMPGTYASFDEATEILRNVRECEARWHRHVLDRRTPPGP
jgi:ppGpp synthetase/RelA/SpoT-type nucleotidyltranferase